MTIQEVVECLQQEKQMNVPSRFPCRAIMVSNIKQYCELLSELKKIGGIRVASTSEIFSSADTMPQYENLLDSERKSEWIILTGVSEYLRLFEENEITARRFAGLWKTQVDAANTGRILIPMWGCKAQWFDKNLNLTGDIRQQDFYFDCGQPDDSEQKMKVVVLAGELEKYSEKLAKKSQVLKVGLRDWFDYWESPNPEDNNFVLFTNRYKSISDCEGSISIHVVSDVLALIRERMPDALLLTQDLLLDDMKNRLLDYALKGASLDEAILNILNVSVFSGVDVMSKWNSMSTSERRFVKLWFSLHPDNSYLCHCISKSEDLKDIPVTVSLEIFRLSGGDEQARLKEYRALEKAMAIVPDEKFFSELSKVSDFEEQLEYLSGNSVNERVYLLRLVGKWFHVDKQQVLSSKRLKEIYPELQAYLSDESISVDEDIRIYMSKYRSYKLANSLPEDDSTFFNGIETDIYDMRYAILSDYVDSNTLILWIDALGIEWLPLLYWSFIKDDNFTVKNFAIGQANLPTETEYNAQWKQMNCSYNKLDALDKLAHKGVIDEPDYYSCIEAQISFISRIHSEASKRMKQYHRVIITGDHGTSTLNKN